MAYPKTNADDGYMTYFGSHTESTLRGLEKEKGHSVFMPSCFTHVEDMCMTAGPVIDGFQYADALSTWFFKGVHHSLYDTCGDLPCSSVCECPNSPPYPSWRIPVISSSADMNFVV